MTVWSLESGVWGLESGVWSLGSGVWGLRTSDLQGKSLGLGLGYRLLGQGHPKEVFESEFCAQVIELGGVESIEEMLDRTVGTRV